MHKHMHTHTRTRYVSFKEKSTTLSQRRKQSSHSPVSLDAVPRELVRDKGGNKSQSTMAFLARFPRTVLRHLQQCSLADDHGDSFFAVCTSGVVSRTSRCQMCGTILSTCCDILHFLLLARIESNRELIIHINCNFSLFMSSIF